MSDDVPEVFRGGSPSHQAHRAHCKHRPFVETRSYHHRRIVIAASSYGDFWVIVITLQSAVPRPVPRSFWQAMQLMQPLTYERLRDCLCGRLNGSEFRVQTSVVSSPR